MTENNREGTTIPNNADMRLAEAAILQAEDLTAERAVELGRNLVEKKLAFYEAAQENPLLASTMGRQRRVLDALNAGDTALLREYLLAEASGLYDRGPEMEDFPAKLRELAGKLQQP